MRPSEGELRSTQPPCAWPRSPSSEPVCPDEERGPRDLCAPLSPHPALRAAAGQERHRPAFRWEGAAEVLVPDVEEPVEEVDQVERPVARQAGGAESMSPKWKSQWTSSIQGSGGHTARVHELPLRDARREFVPRSPEVDGTTEKIHARASQRTTSSPARSAQRARRLRDAVNDKPMRPPATEQVLARRQNRLVGTSEEIPCRWTGASCAIRVPSAPWSPARPRGQLEKR